MLAHNVFFTLAEKSDANRELLIAGCKKYLSDHPGAVFFACGEIAEDLRRDVNDRGFDVALHIIFTDEASHERYQEAPLHLKFIAENEHLWGSVRVFDSVVDR
jgi:Stress responsive A/B Barrel Domain